MSIFDFAIYGLAIYGAYDLAWRLGLIEAAQKYMKHRREKAGDTGV